MKSAHIIRSFLIILICVFADIALHNLPVKMTVAVFEYNALVKTIGLPLSATLYLLVAFGVMAFLFNRNQILSPNRSFTAGARFGVALALLWIVGIMETSPIVGSPVLDEFMGSLADATPILGLGLLLGRFAAPKIALLAALSVKKQSPVPIFRGTVVPVVLILVAYLAGRYFAYAVVGITSGYVQRPLPTLIWTLGMGLSIGIMYDLFSPNAVSRSPLKKALWFGLCLFGINWMIFNLFMCIIFTVAPADLVLRCLIDVFMVSAAIFVSAMILDRTQAQDPAVSTEVPGSRVDGGIARFPPNASFPAASPRARDCSRR